MTDLNTLTRDEMIELADRDPETFFKLFYAELDMKIDDFVGMYAYGGKNAREINGFTLKLVDSVGDAEGEGEHAEKTFALVETINGEIEYAHCQITGYYDSYMGTEWDGVPYPVFPKQIMVTQYFTQRTQYGS